MEVCNMEALMDGGCQHSNSYRQRHVFRILPLVTTSSYSLIESEDSKVTELAVDISCVNSACGNVSSSFQDQTSIHLSK